MSKKKTTDVNKPKEFLSTAEVADWLNVHTSTIYKLVEDKEIHAYKIGRVNRFKRTDIEAYLEKNKS